MSQRPELRLLASIDADITASHKCPRVNGPWEDRQCHSLRIGSAEYLIADSRPDEFPFDVYYRPTAQVGLREAWRRLKEEWPDAKYLLRKGKRRHYRIWKERPGTPLQSGAFSFKSHREALQYLLPGDERIIAFCETGAFLTIRDQDHGTIIRAADGRKIEPTFVPSRVVSVESEVSPHPSDERLLSRVLNLIIEKVVVGSFTPRQIQMLFREVLGIKDEKMSALRADVSFALSRACAGGYLVRVERGVYTAGPALPDHSISEEEGVRIYREIASRSKRVQEFREELDELAEGIRSFTEKWDRELSAEEWDRGSIAAHVDAFVEDSMRPFERFFTGLDFLDEEVAHERR